MEILGGNLATDKAYEAPGLDIYINSKPHQASESGGGDVYYVTNCASGRVTRFLLADISGHGETASELANSLKESLRKNANTISQSNFVRRMNQEFQRLPSTDGQLATAVVGTYFQSQKRLALGLAGHPNPLLYKAADRRWHIVDEQSVPEHEIDDLRNMPLGIVQDSVYPTRNLQIEAGDMVLFYSDAFIESLNRESSVLGIDGVLDLLNEEPSTTPADVIPNLQTSIRALASRNLDEDDATVILVHFNDRKPKIKDTLAAPFRLMGSVRDRTLLGFGQ